MTKTQYVDGFVLVIKKKKLAEYKKMAKEGEDMWRSCGCLDYKECVGEDLNPKSYGMTFLPFGKLVNKKPDELVVFSYITYKSRAHRDQVNKKVMKLMEKQQGTHGDQPMPFDFNRLSYGGFEVIVGA